MAEMSREEAIKVIQTEKECVNRASHCLRNCQECELVMPEEVIVGAYDKAISALSQPERKHGHIEYNEKTGSFECSVCKACWYLITPPKNKYCPECGAKMDGKDESDGN